MSRSILVPIVVVILVLLIGFALFGRSANVAGPAPGTSPSDTATPAQETGGQQQ